jgi:regulator of protease activity HflC (stomatin/prohibitin superfamily)
MFKEVEKHDNSLIKNIQDYKIETHFKWQTIGIIWYLIVASIGSALYVSHAESFKPSIEFSVFMLSPVFFLLVTAIIARWEAAFIMLALTAVGGFVALGPDSWIMITFGMIGGVTGLMIHICKEWERAIVLRLGKFRKVKGPGVFLLIPFIDSVVTKVDLRIRVADFATETTLTRDSVPITVDALCFWLVWDAEKAILEVESYVQAVVLSSQTALRAAISANTLTTLLAEGDKIEEEIRKGVDRKTVEWGITIQHIEITEIEIPEELRKSLSAIAQAEREKNARIRLSEAEKEIALKLEEASKSYENNPIALKLRNLAVLQEGFKNGSSMVLVPSNLPGEIGDDDVFGLKALGEVRGAKVKPSNT